MPGRHDLQTPILNNNNNNNNNKYIHDVVGAARRHRSPAAEQKPMQRTEGCLQDPVQKRQLPPPLDVSFIQTLHRSVSNERNPVEVGFTVYSVTNIDPVSQTFACDLKVFLRWHDSFFANDPDMVSMAASSCMANGDGAVFERVDGIFTKNIVKEIDPVHAAELQPRISFANAASVEEVTQDLVVYLSPNDPLGWVRAEHHYRGTFHQMMGLHAFPFDLQKLEITLRLPHRMDMGREFTQYYNSEGSAEASVKDWVKLSEWERFEPHGTAGTDSKGRAKYTITLPMLRRHRFSTISFSSFINTLMRFPMLFSISDKGCICEDIFQVVFNF